VWEPFAHVSIIGIAGTLIGIYPILKEAAENVMERRMTMELSMTIAILAALAIGQFFTALIIVLLFSLRSAGGPHSPTRSHRHSRAPQSSAE